MNDGGRRRDRAGAPRELYDVAAVLEAERAFVDARRSARSPESERRSGLALGGGGLRAAAFALGALRAFQQRQVFERFDYLSSVSGGAFTAACVGWFARAGCRLSQRPGELLPPEALRFVRRHQGYLAAGQAPVYGADPATTSVRREAGLGSAVFRSAALSLAVHGGLLIGLFFVLGRLDAVVQLLKPVLRLVSLRPPWISMVEVLDFGLLAAGVLLGVALLTSLLWPVLRAFSLAWQQSFERADPLSRSAAWRGAAWGLLALISALFGIASLFSDAGRLWTLFLTVLLAFCARSSFRHWRAHWSAASRAPSSSAELDPRGAFSALGVALGFVPALVLGIAILGYVFSSGAHHPAQPPRLDVPFGVLLVVVTVVFLAWFLPRGVRRVGRFIRALFSDGVRGANAAQAGVASERARSEWQHQSWLAAALRASRALLVLGSVPLVSHLLDRWARLPGPRLAVLAALGIGGLLLLIRRAPAPIGCGTPSREQRPASVLGALGGALLLYGTLLFAHACVLWIQNSSVVQLVLLIPIAALALGGLSNVDQASPGQAYRRRLAEAFLPNDSAAQQNVWQPALEALEFPLARAADSARAPYLLFNAALRVRASANARRSARGADSFLLSPLFCGSPATGYAETERWAGGSLRLSDAMGISAARVAPGRGPSAGSWGNRWVWHTLALLNLRLSVWMENPGVRHEPGSVRARPSFLDPLLWQAFSRGPSERQAYVELSDGAHFEELGLYELVRRRLGLIVLVDGTLDPDGTQAALGRAVQRIVADLDVVVELPGLAAQRAREADVPTARDAPAALVGRIHYPGGIAPGTLVYLRPVLLRDLPIEVESLAAEDPSFPQQNTADADFSERQFFAYEELGRQLAWRACAELPELGGTGGDGGGPRPSSPEPLRSEGRVARGLHESP
jgi:hypothetical protein